MQIPSVGDWVRVAYRIDGERRDIEGRVTAIDTDRRCMEIDTARITVFFDQIERGTVQVSATR